MKRTESVMGYLSSSIYYTTYLEGKLVSFFDEYLSTTANPLDENNGRLLAKNLYSFVYYEKVLRKAMAAYQVGGGGGGEYDLIVSIPSLIKPVYERDGVLASYEHDLSVFEEFMTVYKSRITH